MIEEHFKLKDVTPKKVYLMKDIETEEHFKLKDVTPKSK